MPKKGTKKIYSMRRRAIKTMKQLEKEKRQAEQAKRNILRQRDLTVGRGEKEFMRTSNANNTTHTVPIQVKPLPEAVAVENVENVENVQNESVNNASWNNYPTNVQVLGFPRKGKFQQTKRLSNKQKRQMERAQTQKQRNVAIQQARQLKAAERSLENVNLENLVVQNNVNNVRSMTTEEFYNRLAKEAEEEEREMERLEKEYEERLIKDAQAKMNKAPKNNFTVRINDTTNMSISNFMNYIRIRQPRKFEILYLDDDPYSSFYYIFKFREQPNSNQDSMRHGFRYGRYRGYNPVYAIYTKPPLFFFKPFFTPHSWNFYGPNENNNSNTQDAEYVTEEFTNMISRFIYRLPRVKQQIKKEEAAKARAPYKLKELQLKGLEGWIEQMEQKTGQTFPRNVQNLVEQSIRPFDYRYYQGRDNLQRIKTDLFQ